MNEFRTVVKVCASEHTLGLNHQILTLGSCFSDAIGAKLQASKIPTIANPFGVIYNPVSLHKAIRYAVFNETVPQHTYLQHHDLHLNYDFHSEFSALEKPLLEEKLKNAIGATHYFLKDCRWLIITYGTAWVYERADTHEVVANCHKVPAELFTRSLLTQKKILESFEQLYHDLMRFNAGIRIILTVSPVRHVKDTLVLNSVSKSILRATCHTLTETFKNVEYFPSYEIMMDDLRDYRFYKPDMLHPTGQAEEYIWEKFIEQYADEPVKKFLPLWKQIRTALDHKPFHPASAGHQVFLKQTLNKLEELKSIVNVDEEIRIVRSQLRSAG